jgi:hypothetical protein
MLWKEGSKKKKPILWKCLKWCHMALWNFRLRFEPLGLPPLIILQQLKAIQGRTNWWGTSLHLFVFCVWAQAQGEGEEGAWWCYMSTNEKKNSVINNINTNWNSWI